MESTVVIKVKYGETIRRFNARLVDKELDLDMDGLKEKIVCLFNFAPNTDLALTYIDEDGDVVTLVDDEDLLDVIRQSLHPLRITVRLNTEKGARSGARSYARSSGSSTPMRSPRIQHSLQNLNTNVSEILKSVPEPAREALSKLPFDLAYKATLSGPEIADLIDYFSKMGLAYLNLAFKFQAGAISSTQTGASLGTTGFSVAKDQKDSKVEGATSEMLEYVKSEAPTVKNNEVLPNVENEEQADLGNVNICEEASVMQAPGSVNINVGVPTDNILFGSVTANIVPGKVHVVVDDKKEVNKFGEHRSSEKSDKFVHMNAAPVATIFPAVDKNKGDKKSSESLGPKSIGMPVANDGIGSVFHPSVTCDGCKVHPITGPRFKSKVKNYDLCSICFAEMGNVADYIRMDRPVTYRQPSVQSFTSTKSDDFVHLNVAPVATIFPAVEKNKEVKKSSESLEPESVGMPVANDGIGSVFHPGVTCDGCEVHPITGPRFKSKVKNYDLCSICFAEMGNVADYIRMDHPATYRQPSVQSFTCTKSDDFVHLNVAPVATIFPAVDKNKEVKKSSESLGPESVGMPVANDGIGSVFHPGVTCDGCEVHPITGPRFKSKVKNYDLCSICFAELGNVADYIRMDRPMTYWQPSMDHSRWHPPTLPQVSRGSEKKPSRPKLDSHFIQDVNVLDGTIMAPSTPFTKIWRMKNNGTIVWPQGTQLLWIGGDRLSNTPFVEIEIPADGIPVDKELDIAVDFTAPELPGSYISYWRMALTSGQKFGQHVWVLIQVDTSMKDSWCEGIHELNLNLPPVSIGITGTEILNVNAEPMVDSIAEPDDFTEVTELVEPIVYARPNKEQELNFPFNDTLLIGGGVSSPAPPKAALPVLYPITEFSEVAPIVPSPALSPTMDMSSPAQEVSDVEQALLRELEEMGFKQVDLNKKILRMNEYNLEQSVDDLCDVAEWGPILAELQEMGLCDEEVKNRLLEKNNGNIKRVVMDLVAGDKA